jgi:hypothetical protein
MPPGLNRSYFYALQAEETELFTPVHTVLSRHWGKRHWMPPRLGTLTCCTLRVEATRCPHACIHILDCYILETGRAGVLRLFQETDSKMQLPLPTSVPLNKPELTV